MRLFANANFDFLRHRRVAFITSGVVLGLLFATALVWQVTRGSWMNYGVDFTGGTLVQVQIREETSVAELREVLETTAPGSEITRFGGENEYLIRAPQFSEGGENVADQIAQTLEQRFGEQGVEIVRTEAVGARVGSELQQKAFFAILLSFLVTLIYLAFRFEWRFGVASIVAAMHDILVVLGFIAAFQIEVSLTIVAAILTVLGYTLNDTIVVFDRVRENLKISGRRESFIDIINRSINETLPRTVLTSGTTTVVLVSLFLIAGGAIRDFALVLLIGVIVGTFSSIFMASPVLLEIRERWKPEQPSKGGRSPRKAGARI